MSIISPPPSTGYPTLRPWRTLLGSFSLPHSLSFRLRLNLSHFQSNYALISLIILLLSLLFHPLSLLVLLSLSLLSYFSLSRPLFLFHRPIHPRFLLLLLFTVTVLALVFTGVWVNLLVSGLISVVLVGFHAAFRVPEELFLDEDEAASGGLMSVVAGSPRSSRSTFASV